VRRISRLEKGKEKGVIENTGDKINLDIVAGRLGMT
jgi:hypothetical protein